MATPPLFQMSRDASVAWVAENPFAVLFTSGATGPMASHVPLVGWGPDRLVGHVSRGNPQVDALDGEALAVFSGPHAAVSSRWYGAPEAHVPTWNYVAVHAAGVVRRLDDPLPALAALMARMQPGDPVPSGDAERDALVARMAGGIVAFEMVVTRWEGKAKLSQNRSRGDAERVATALDARGGPGDVGVAAAMRAWLGRADA
jgi:transcriptional regulator